MPKILGLILDCDDSGPLCQGLSCCGSLRQQIRAFTFVLQFLWSYCCGKSCTCDATSFSVKLQCATLNSIIWRTFWLNKGKMNISGSTVLEFWLFIQICLIVLWRVLYTWKTRRHPGAAEASGPRSKTWSLATTSRRLGASYLLHFFWFQFF